MIFIFPARSLLLGINTNNLVIGLLLSIGAVTASAQMADPRLPQGNSSTPSPNPALVSGVPQLRSAPQPLLPTQSATGSGNAASLGSVSPTIAAMGLEPLAPNEFQKFVFESIGSLLPLYGTDFFQNSQAASVGANPFVPAQNTPVSSDYALGAGDEVLIRGWGAIEVDVRATIDRNGAISIPRVGTVQLAGVKAAQAEGVIKAAIGRYFRDFELSVTLGQLRSVTVYVVGQARRPGTYTLSSISTLVSGLFASGGPNANGSMRKVQLKRAGRVVTEFDLYTFLAQGNSAGDARLMDGDVIFIPSAYGHIALTGKVTTPGIYEIKNEGENLGSVLFVAGGTPVVADSRKVFLERINPMLAQPRQIEEFALDTAGLQKPLRRGDLLSVLGVVPEFSNAITLRGNVSQPQRQLYKAGMRIRDLIPTKDVLISRASVVRQNDVLLSPDSRDARPVPLTREEMQSPRGTRDSIDTLAGRIGNLIDEVNFDYAVIERVDKATLSVKLIPFNLGRVLANAADPDNLPLLAGDVVTVFSVTDVRVPLAKRRVYVRVEGEVSNPGVYQMSSGDNLQSLVDKAGGLTRDAYLFGSAFYREEVKKTQTDNFEKLIRRLEAESSAALTQSSQSNGASDTLAATAQARIQVAQAAQRQALDRLRTIKPTGRIALDVPASGGDSVANLPALRLESGDRLVVSSRPDFVYVFGSVNVESALIHKPGKTVVDYLEQAGLTSGADRENVILVRADGSAQTNSSNWSNSVLRTQVMPGDTLVLPEKVDRETGWSFFIRNTKDLTQIFYQLGIGAAALKTLRQ